MIAGEYYCTAWVTQENSPQIATLIYTLIQTAQSLLLLTEIKNMYETTKVIQKSSISSLITLL